MWPEVAMGVASGLTSGGLNLASNAMTNKANIDLARESNKQAVELSNTQYQRSMADMKAANLNPALMYGSAGPAPTPPIQTPQLRATDFGSAFDKIMQGVSLKQAQQSIDNGYLMQLEQIAKIKAEIANLPSSTGMLDLQKQLTKAQVRLAEFNAQPNTLNELGTKLLNRFLEHLEGKYNANNRPGSKEQFIREMTTPRSNNNLLFGNPFIEVK